MHFKIFLLFLQLCYFISIQATQKNEKVRSRKMNHVLKRNSSAYLRPTPMVIRPSQIENLTATNHHIEKRNVFKNENNKWPDAKVPYVIADIFSERQEKIVLRGMKEIQDKTCIRFVERDHQEDYVQIGREGRRCFSDVGRKGGRQTMSLSVKCSEDLGDVLHELMHALGFIHEQSRPDRDEFVKINNENIREEGTGNFAKYKPNQIDYLGEPYDYKSVMQYPSHEFSIGNGLKTIVKKNNGGTLPQSEHLSKADIRRLRKFYECDE